jgi:hypothetical protein
MDGTRIQKRINLGSNTFTDSYRWRWIFFNFPVGILATLLVMRLVEDPPCLGRKMGAGVGIDYIGTRWSVADAPKLAYGLIYRFVAEPAVTLAYIDGLIVLAIAASIMFLLSFIVRQNDLKVGGGMVGVNKLFGGC